VDKQIKYTGIIRRGAKGPRVKNIQQALRAHGYSIGPLDGHYGSKTLRAVKAFQKREGLKSDGVIGKNTFRSLFKHKPKADRATIKAIQRALAQRGYAPGPIDGVWGQRTSLALKAFQAGRSLRSTGAIDSQTQRLLLSQSAKPISRNSLLFKCLSLTGTFETGKRTPGCFSGLSGNFDGQGVSFGALQWNLGQGSLQPLIIAMAKTYPTVIRNIFKQRYVSLMKAMSMKSKTSVRWATSIQSRKHRIKEPWKQNFIKLGQTDEYQSLQAMAARRLFNSALQLCKQYKIYSQRAAALMFDIKVQNGSIKQSIRQKIFRDIRGLPKVLSRKAFEEANLTIIANRRAEGCNKRWVEDVRRRKLCIATGKGTVHGLTYDLKRQFGISLKPLDVL